MHKITTSSRKKPKTTTSPQWFHKMAKSHPASNHSLDKTPHNKPKNSSNSTWGFLNNRMREMIQVNPKKRREKIKEENLIHWLKFF